ncbi:MAG: hypothetical protein U1F49_04255 [Rubrivivax sp.]
MEAVDGWTLGTGRGNGIAVARGQVDMALRSPGKPRPGQPRQYASGIEPRSSTAAERADFDFFPEPQYWVATNTREDRRWALAFRDITNPTNIRTAIAAIVPHRRAGNTLPLLLPDPELSGAAAARSCSLLLATMNSRVRLCHPAEGEGRT